MNFNAGFYNRYVTFQTPTDVNTKGSLTRTWASTFTSYAQKEGNQQGRKESSDSMEEAGKRTTISKSTWRFPYNSAIVKDGRFYEGNATTLYYYVVGVSENKYQTEMIVEAELRV